MAAPRDFQGQHYLANDLDGLTDPNCPEFRRRVQTAVTVVALEVKDETPDTTRPELQRARDELAHSVLTVHPSADGTSAQTGSLYWTDAFANAVSANNASINHDDDVAIRNGVVATWNGVAGATSTDKV